MFFSVPGSFEKAKGHFGKLDIVVNNAAVAGETDWEKAHDVNMVPSTFKQRYT